MLSPIFCQWYPGNIHKKNPNPVFADHPRVMTEEDGIVTITEFLMWPLWIVAIYLVVVIFCPLTIYLHKKNPYPVFADYPRVIILHRGY